MRLSPPLTRKWVICYCAFLWCLSQLPVGTSLLFLTCCRHGSLVVDGIMHLQSLFICCPAVVSSEYSEYLLNIVEINSKIFKVACPNKDCRLLNCDEGRVIIFKLASWMCSRHIWSVMLSCQYGAKSLQNVSATFLDLCHEDLRRF